MGAHASRHPTSRPANEASLPLVQGAVVGHGPFLEFSARRVGGDVSNNAYVAAAPRNDNRQRDDEDDGEICAVCISGLARATTFQLPMCGHDFHALCIASALHVCMFCPICRAEVDPTASRELARQLAADSSHGGKLLAAELLLGLKLSGPTATIDSEISPEATVEALKRAVRRGDASKIPSIAALLHRGSGSEAQSAEPKEVRLAAVESLCTLVPGECPLTWPGTPNVVNLLCLTVSLDEDEDVRLVALRGLSAICEKADQSALVAIQEVLRNSQNSADLRIQAASTLSVIAARGDPCSIQTALLAAQDSDPSAKSSALGTLRHVCAPRGSCADILPDIAALATSHREPEVRMAMLALLAQAEEEGGQCGIDAATVALQDQDDAVRQAALQALKSLWPRGDGKAVATLAALALGKGYAEADVHLRREALVALGQVAPRGDPTTLRAAARLLGDLGQESLRRDALQVIRIRCGARGSDENQDIIKDILAGSRSTDSDVKILAIEALGILGDPRDEALLPALRALHNEDDTSVQLAVTSALRQLGISA